MIQWQFELIIMFPKFFGRVTFGNVHPYFVPQSPQGFLR